MSDSEKFHLRSAGHGRDVVAILDANVTFVDRQSGTAFKPVGRVPPLTEGDSALPWSEENLRLCGCTREQFVPKDVNDCPYCDRRIPAATGLGSGDAG